MLLESGLSNREIDVLMLFAKRLSNKEIAKDYPFLLKQSKGMQPTYT